jgi:ABC-type uncharacterized transport system ATPase component
MRYTLNIVSPYGGWTEMVDNKHTALRVFEELKSSLVYGERLEMIDGDRVIKEVRR